MMILQLWQHFVDSFSGQIELYTHLPVMKQLVEQLQQREFRVCGVFLVDSQFMVESFKVTRQSRGASSVYFVHCCAWTWGALNVVMKAMVSHFPSSPHAVHLRSHGRPECHGVVRDPSNKHHDQNGPAESQSQEGDWEVSAVGVWKKNKKHVPCFAWSFLKNTVATKTQKRKGHRKLNVSQNCFNSIFCKLVKK